MGENMTLEWERDPHAGLVWDALQLLKTDPEGGISALLDLGARGSPLALMYAASRYANGTDNVPKNERMAVKLFQEAFDLGSFEAGFHLGHMYMASGSFAEGLETYTRLSDMGYAPAMYRLGYEYGYGDPSIRNVEKGEESWKRGARHGHFFAAYGIGNLLLRRRTIRGFVEGWIRKLASLRLMPSFVSFRLNYPNSDRLRT
jgi:hypothetical protein